MKKMTTCLWFDGNAEEAARFYISLFKGSKMGSVVRCGDSGPGPKESVMTVAFRVNGQEFLGLNGGSQFKFNESVSFMVNCGTQKEIDRLWKKLSRGGKEIQCGWVKDKFGLVWQIIPAVLGKMVRDRDPQKSDRVMKALMPMVKLDIKKLKRAYEGR
jgi:predicted 3-demethylubiquinone-9 3-methyltransferase (glyoxalase superfamily)